MRRGSWSRSAQLRRRAVRQARRAAGSVRAVLGGEKAHRPPEEDAEYNAHVAAVGWPIEPDERLSIGGERFLFTHTNTTSSLAVDEKEFFVYKRPSLIQAYRKLGKEGGYKTVVELGILNGGSTAFLFQLLEPEILVAFDVVHTPVPALERFVDEHELQGRLRPYYGVDQADTGQLLRLVDEATGGKPLDLVVDDASHSYAPTRASFNALFPRLRDGGVFVIEDWAWAHVPGEHFQRHGGPFPGEPALTNLIVEIMLLQGTRPDLVPQVEVRRNMVQIVRGRGDLPVPMDMATLILNRGNPFHPSV